MLAALKQRVAPTDQARKIELINQYQKLKKAPRSQNLDTWLQQWEKTYKECKQLKLPDVQDDHPLYDFLNAISGIAPEFANVWTINIQMKLDSGDALPDLYKIVELFRNNNGSPTRRKASQHTALSQLPSRVKPSIKTSQRRKSLAFAKRSTTLKTAHISCNRLVRRIGNLIRVHKRKSTRSYESTQN